MDRILLTDKESKLTDKIIKLIEEEKVSYTEADKALTQVTQELYKNALDRVINFCDSDKIGNLLNSVDENFAAKSQA